MQATRRVRVSVPRLPGHVVEFGADRKVVLYGPDATYTAYAKPGVRPADAAASLVAEVAEGRA